MIKTDAFRAQIRRALLKIKPSFHHYLLSPSVGFVIIFYFIPIVLTALIAFTAMSETFEWEFVGFKNFARIFSGADPIISRVVINTAIYVAGCLPLTIGVALVVSYLSMRIKKPVGLFFRAVFFFPRVIPPVVWGFLWMWSFEGTRYGLINSVFGTLVHWLTEYPMLIVILANGFLGVALAMLIFTSAIATIPVDYTRAARVDGASDLQTFRHIVIPLLKWPIALMAIWHLMSFINSYVYIMLITGGGPYHATEVWSLYGYYSAFEAHKYGFGASLMIILVIVNAILFLLAWKAFGIKRMIKPARVEA